MNIDKVFKSAITEYNQGSLEQAEALCRKILLKKPKFADALNLLGLISYARRDYDAAVSFIQKALRHSPDNFFFHNNLGTAYKAIRQPDDALVHYRRALQLNPGFPDAYNNLGTVLQGKRQIDDAVEYYQKALQLNPQYADAYFNLGTAHRAKGRYDEAAQCYEKAVQLNPGFIEAYINLGADSKERGDLQQALQYFQKVLQLNPSFAEAYINIGSVLSDQGKLADAETYLRRALELNPDLSVCHSNLLLLMNYSSRYDNQSIFQEHLNFAEHFARPLAADRAPHKNERIPDRRIRIGYVSSDFKRHSVNFFAEPVLSGHDRQHFEVFCYSDVLAPDEVTQRLQTYPLQWRDIAGMPDEQAASLVRSDNIDILVDLTGHTGHNRMLLFARKPAPVQVSWLGYPNTTGLPTVDYRIVDGYTDPPGLTDPFNTEKLIRMPETFLCYRPDEDTPETGPLPSLSAGHVTFGSFNTIPKISPEVVVTWSRILNEVPESRLFLKAKSLFDSETRTYLSGLFREQGITDGRVELMAQTESHKDHLALYNKVDLCLDTFPYHGTTTTCEALWMGVPVITLAGDRHASRVGVSLLSNTGLPELVAQTEQEYVGIAVKLAGDRERLQSLRKGLRDMMANSPLRNPERFIAELEDRYRTMWQDYCKS